MTRQFEIEKVVDRSLARSARDAAERDLRTRADSAVVAALATCRADERPAFALALLDRAVDAVCTHHDGAMAQACLGKAASKQGAELLGAGGAARRAAERHFRKAGE